MPDWVIITTLLFLTLILGGGLLLLARQRKNERTELRLLTGRHQLLSSELDACFAELNALDEGVIATRRQEAEVALDQLHVALVERQAHLLNYEDMAHLQQCKIDLLTTSPVSSIPSDPAPEREEPPTKKRPTRRAVQTQREEKRDRSAIESDLLHKISQLQGDKKTKK